MTADTIREPLTRSSEDYLKAIFHLTQGGEAAGTTDLAQALDLAPASVSGMIKRLSEQGLLAHEPYRGVKLTAEGRRIALRMLRPIWWPGSTTRGTRCTTRRSGWSTPCPMCWSNGWPRR